MKKFFLAVCAAVFLWTAFAPSPGAGPASPETSKSFMMESELPGIVLPDAAGSFHPRLVYAHSFLERIITYPSSFSRILEQPPEPAA